MNILKIFFLLFFIVSFISCGKEEKITILKNENIEEQMIELYNEGYTEFLNGDTLYAAKKYNVQTQMGNQGRSSDEIRKLKEWIDDDAIGPVRELYAG